MVLDDPVRLRKFWAALTGDPISTDSAGIGLEQDGELIAVVLFDGYNGASICMHVAAVPGAHWMTREYLYFCFAYPFRQLGVKKILGLVGSGNLPARRFDEHLGFVLEATLKDAHPDGDLLVYGMHLEACRWLNVKRIAHGKERTAAAT